MCYIYNDGYLVFKDENLYLRSKLFDLVKSTFNTR